MGTRAPAGDPDAGTVTCVVEKKGAEAGAVIAIGTVPDVEGTPTPTPMFGPPASAACSPP